MAIRQERHGPDDVPPAVEEPDAVGHSGGPGNQVQPFQPAPVVPLDLLLSNVFQLSAGPTLPQKMYNLIDQLDPSEALHHLTNLGDMMSNSPAVIARYQHIQVLVPMLNSLAIQRPEQEAQSRFAVDKINGEIEKYRATEGYRIDTAVVLAKGELAEARKNRNVTERRWKTELITNDNTLVVTEKTSDLTRVVAETGIEVDHETLLTNHAVTKKVLKGRQAMGDRKANVILTDEEVALLRAERDRRHALIRAKLRRKDIEIYVGLIIAGIVVVAALITFLIVRVF